MPDKTPESSRLAETTSPHRSPLIHEELTNRILRCAVAVHRALGPGLMEYSYQVAMSLELEAQAISFVREPIYAVRYRDILVGWHKPDFVVENKVIELKAVTMMTPVFNKQLLTYLRVSGMRVGLLLNFNVTSLSQDGIRRFVL